MSKIILVTGGQRSGKSKFAESLALNYSKTPIYIATARIFDNEMSERVKTHQLRRGSNWTNIEDPYLISDYKDIIDNRVVLIDCLTMLATNYFFNEGEDDNRSYDRIIKAMESFINPSSSAVYIFVTNEIGLGGTSDNSMQRRFTDLQGKINQHIADRADEVYFIISGIPVKIK